VNMIKISVVIPAYNEETNIRLGALDKVFRYFEHVDYASEIIIVDDGSSDATPLLLDKVANSVNNLHIIHNPHQGKAATVITGMLKAQGDIVLFTDLDQATPIIEIQKLLPWFEKGFDVVIGSRNSNREGAPILRLLMARGFMFLRGLILGLRGISDTQCGFKAFRKTIAQKIFTKLKLYGNMHTISGSMVTAGFDIEVLYLAKLLGYKIKEVPVEWHYVETRRVNPIKDSIHGLTDIIAIRINAMKGMYR
jgi:dolichyl-phosphate beta-glucosyltransferase